jgi:hypothetical protein
MEAGLVSAIQRDREGGAEPPGIRSRRRAPTAQLLALVKVN